MAPSRSFILAQALFMQRARLGVNLARESPSRRVLTALKSGPADLDQLAAEVDLHRTVVHTHLRRLLKSGLVQVDRKVTSGPGRPGHLYRLSEEAQESSWPPRQHRLLASVLGLAVAAGAASPQRVAKAAGLQCGQDLQLTELASLEHLGWEYRLLGDRLMTTNCAFREACSRSNGIACHVHAGMLQVALGRRIGLARRIDSGCQFRLGAPLTSRLRSTSQRG
jgi:predicted ArsR family transcriptional regulator